MNQNKTTHTLSDKQLSLLLAMLVAIMPFSIDTYLPAMTDVAHSLNSSVHLVEKSLSTYLLGAAMGQLIGGSLSDLKGRKSEQSLQVVIKRLCPPEDVEAEDDVKAAPQRVQYPERALPLNLNDG